jgi:hypothetical protein
MSYYIAIMDITYFDRHELTAVFRVRKYPREYYIYSSVAESITHRKSPLSVSRIKKEDRGIADARSTSEEEENHVPGKNYSILLPPNNNLSV